VRELDREFNLDISSTFMAAIERALARHQR
jgi:hypothetical protein